MEVLEVLDAKEQLCVSDAAPPGSATPGRTSGSSALTKRRVPWSTRARRASVASCTWVLSAPSHALTSGSGAPRSVRAPSVRRTVPSLRVCVRASAGRASRHRANARKASVRARASPGTPVTATAPSMCRARGTQSVPAARSAQEHVRSVASDRRSADPVYEFTSRAASHPGTPKTSRNGSAAAHVGTRSRVAKPQTEDANSMATRRLTSHCWMSSSVDARISSGGACTTSRNSCSRSETVGVPVPDMR